MPGVPWGCWSGWGGSCSGGELREQPAVQTCPPRCQGRYVCTAAAGVACVACVLGLVLVTRQPCMGIEPKCRCAQLVSFQGFPSATRWHRGRCVQYFISVACNRLVELSTATCGCSKCIQWHHVCTRVPVLCRSGAIALWLRLLREQTDRLTQHLPSVRPVCTIALDDDSRLSLTKRTNVLVMFMLCRGHTHMLVCMPRPLHGCRNATNASVATG